MKFSFNGSIISKLDLHFNASLAAVNLAKAACKRLGITYFSRPPNKEGGNY